MVQLRLNLSFFFALGVTDIFTTQDKLLLES